LEEDEERMQIHSNSHHNNGEINMLYCHHCRQKRPENIVRPCTNPVDPKGVPCTKRYCRLCFERFYPGLYDTITNGGSAAWSCPYCSGYCCCTRCNNKKYPSYPPRIASEESWMFDGDSPSLQHAIYTHKDDNKGIPTPRSIINSIPYRPIRPKKRPKVTKTEPSESDPAWAELSLKYLQYAKKLAHHSHIPVSNVRQLPSITHMIAISSQTGLEEVPWRWCDAYHAIKYLKDHEMVTTSRGARGTSIKEDHHTVDDLISQLETQINSTDQQGTRKPSPPPKDVKVAVHLQHPTKPKELTFNMLIGDLMRSSSNETNTMDPLYARVKSMLIDMHEEKWLRHTSNLRLHGYSEKGTGDFIHANMFTSIPELVTDAAELRLICS